MDLEIVFQKRQQSRFVVLARLYISQRVPFAWINLQLIRLIGFDEHVNELGRVIEVNVFINQPVDYKKSVVSAINNWKLVDICQ